MVPVARSSAAATLLLLGNSFLPAAAVERLTVVNKCDRAPIWIAHLANVGVGPGQQNVKINPGESFAFSNADTDGLSGARYWPKMGCDEHGDNCAMGGSGGPTQKCSEKTPDYSSCAPPIDTKFEATWGRSGEPCDPADPGTMTGCDFVDISLVDGWTLPFSLDVTSGRCTTTKDEVMDRIDCSTLSVDKCPKDDNLGKGPVDMTAVSPHSKEAVGCYSPCLKLIDDKWGNTLAAGRSREEGDVVPYCCTTPPEDSAKCNAGPIVDTKYVNAVHKFCPGVYSFAYDDGIGLLRCEYAAFRLSFFCPEGLGGVPPPVTQPPAPQEPLAEVVAPAAAKPQQASPASPSCSTNENCAASRCCVDEGKRCYEKDEGWASCRSSCAAGAVNPADPPQLRTPWTCRELSEAPFPGQPTAGQPEPPAGPVAAQPEVSTDPQSCQFLGCGSSGSGGNCACDQPCVGNSNCCPDYHPVCIPQTIQRDEVLTDAKVYAGGSQSEMSIWGLHPAALGAGSLGLFALATAIAAASLRGHRADQMGIGSVPPME